MTSLVDPRFEGTVRLRDGRRLGVAEFGPVSGRPLLWFHGTPGARRQIAPEARALALQRGVRIVSVERPGIGDSTPHAYERLVDYAHDIEQLADALDIGRFAVAGLSGGGPYALACAHEMPERVPVAAVLGGVAPAIGPDAVLGGATTLIRLTSGLIERGNAPLGGLMRTLVRGLEPFMESATDLFARAMPPGDRAVLNEPTIRRMFQEDLLLGSRRNMRAIFFDVALFGRHWGFALEDVETPVFLRYGDSDNIVPASHGQHLADRLPNAKLRVYTGEGHLGSLGASREVFDVILEHWPEAATPAGP
jgi:pimeloyl-ACP methyl ester carboxylesterase